MSTIAARVSRSFGSTDLLVVGMGAVCLFGVVLGASGVSAFVAFSQVSTLKYALTVAAPVFLLSLSFTDHKLRLVGWVLFVALPFGSYATTFAGVTVPLDVVLLALAVPVALASRPVVVRPTVSRAASCCVAVLAAALGLALLRGSGELDYLRTIVGVVGAVLVARAVLHVLGRRELMLMIVVSGAVQGGLAVFEYFTGRVTSFYGADLASGSYAKDYFFSLGAETRRATGAYSDPISLGNVLCLAGILGAVLLAEASMRRRVWPLLALVAMNASVVAGLVVTYSRTSWVAYVVGVLVAVVWSQGAQRRRLGWIVATGIAVVLAFTPLLGSALAARVLSIFNPTNPMVDTAEGDLTRIQLWRVAADVALDNPFNGVGVGNLNGYLVEQVSDTTVFSHAHNTFLQLTAEAGYPAGIAVLGLLAVALGTAGRRRSSPTFPAAAGGAVTAIAVMWTTDFTVRYLSVAAVVAAVLVLALHAADERSTEDIGRDQRDAGDAPGGQGEIQSRSASGSAVV